jgi:hypothetical protein
MNTDVLIPRLSREEILRGKFSSLGTWYNPIALEEGVTAHALYSDSDHSCQSVVIAGYDSEGRPFRLVLSPEKVERLNALLESPEE